MSKTKQESEPISEEAILFPGKKFEVEGGAVFVVPVGLRQLRKFSGTIAQLMGIIGAEAEPGKKMNKGAVVAVLMPHILSSAIDLFEDCVKVSGVSLDDVHHWEIPEMMEYWILESFGETKKWKPWVKMVETLVGRLTGEKIDLSEELSKLSSQPDTPSPTS